MSKKTFEVAEKTKVGLIVQVKSNQPTLLQAATGIALTTPPLSADHSHDKARGRDENRIVEVFKPAGQLDETDWKNHVETVIRVKRIVYTRSSKTGLLSQTAEVAFYISNKELTAKAQRSQFVATGASKQPAIIAAMSQWVRVPVDRDH